MFRPVSNHRGPSPSQWDLERRGFSRYRNADSYILTKLRYDQIPSPLEGINSIQWIIEFACVKVFASDPEAFTFRRERCIYAGEIMSVEFAWWPANIRVCCRACYFDTAQGVLESLVPETLWLCMGIYQNGAKRS